MAENKTDMQTGYPSIDKPWLKYYSEEAKKAPLPHMTMYDYAWENNKGYLSDIAFRYFDRLITYRMFFDEVKKAADAFWKAGVRKGDIVTIMSMHTPEAIYAIYGLNYIGAVANLIYLTLSEKEILKYLKTTQSRMLLVLDVAIEKIVKIRDLIDVPVVVLSVTDSMPTLLKTIVRLKSGNPQKKVKGCNGEFVTYRDFISNSDSEAETEHSSDCEAVAVIVYTSGTTGDPKGVCLTNDNLNAMVFQDINGLVKFIRKKNCLFMIPPFTGYGIGQLHILVSCGIETILHIRPDPEAVVKAYLKYKPYCFLTGPSLVLSLLPKNKRCNLSSASYFLGGGGALNPTVEEELNAYLKVCGSSACYSNGYGMTETASVLVLNVNEFSKKGSAGLPFLRTSVKVVDTDTGVELKYGEVGELYFSTPCIMEGYYNNPRETAEMITTDSEGTKWIRTGDIGYVNEDGFVFLKGRLKRIYPTRSADNVAYKIFPQRIEELYESKEGISFAGVIVREDPKRLNVPILFVETESAANFERKKKTKELQQIAINELPEHMRPVEIHIIDKMPLTALGKIDYKVLEKMEIA